jgi:lipopolysaccharide/colanic/teichoic acid biosynthesis glycosyltransferase
MNGKTAGGTEVQARMGGGSMSIDARDLLELDDPHGVTAIGVRRFGPTRFSGTVKRAFDLLGASLCLLAALPLLVAIAIAIKLDGAGPVFFRQLRVGRHGKGFYMLKFRTMVPDAEALKDSLRDRNEAREGLFKIVDDPRTTRVGRLLRKSALDELPQLLNILRGVRLWSRRIGASRAGTVADWT